MIVKPLTKLIIVTDTHLEIFQEGYPLDILLKKLQEMKFELLQEFEKPSILIFKNSEIENSPRQTHILINLNELISEINFYVQEF